MNIIDYMKKCVKVIDLTIVGLMCVMLFSVFYFQHIIKYCFFYAFLLMIINIFLKYGGNFKKAFSGKSCSLRPCVLFLAAMFLSVIFSVDSHHSISVFMERYLIYFLIFLIGVYIPKNKKVLFSFVLAVLLTAIVYCFGLFWRWEGFSNRMIVSYGFSTMAVFPLLFFCSFSMIFSFIRVKHLKVLAVFTFLLVCIGIFFHKGRTGWLILIFNFFLLFFLIKKRKIAYMAVILTVAVIFFVPGLKYRLKNCFTTPSFVTRLELWQTAFDIWQEYPIVGAGLGTYEYKVVEYRPKDGFADGQEHLHAHSTFMEILADTGIVGFFSFIVLMFFFFFHFSRYFMRNKFTDTNIVFLFLLACFFFWCSTMIAALSATIMIVGLMGPLAFWFLMGVSDNLLCDEFKGRIINKKNDNDKGAS